MSEPTYYFYADAEGNERGPYNTAQMRALALSGTLTLVTPVYLSGTEHWLTLAQFPELTGEIGASRPPQPPRASAAPGTGANAAGIVLIALGALSCLAGLAFGFPGLVVLGLFGAVLIVVGARLCTGGPIR